jgi:hypothetical protein
MSPSETARPALQAPLPLLRPEPRKCDRFRFRDWALI